MTRGNLRRTKIVLASGSGARAGNGEGGAAAVTEAESGDDVFSTTNTKQSQQNGSREVYK